MFRCFLLSCKTASSFCKKNTLWFWVGVAVRKFVEFMSLLRKCCVRYQRYKYFSTQLSSQINLVVFQKKGVEVQHPSKFNSLKSNHNFQKAKKSKVESVGFKGHWMTWPGDWKKTQHRRSHEKIWHARYVDLIFRDVPDEFSWVFLVM